MRPRGTALLALQLACGPPGPSPGAEDVVKTLAELARAGAEEHAELVALQAQATDLRGRAEDIAAIWRTGEEEFRLAKQYYESAVQHGQAATGRFVTAIDDFERAERRYRLTTLLVIAVAASSDLCASTVSTRKFRAQLRAEGVDLKSMDIDHVWPRSLGGVDHPMNYQVLDSHLNRSLGAGVVEKFLTQPLALVQGLAVSALSAISC
jgi:hypothetical protein